MRIFVKYILFIGAILSFGSSLFTSCQRPDTPNPDEPIHDFYISANVNGENKVFLSKSGYSLLVPATPSAKLILRANEGYSKVMDVPGFELHFSFLSFPPAPGVYTPAESDNNFIQYNFVDKGQVQKAKSISEGNKSKIVVKKVIPSGTGFILEGTFVGLVQAKEGNSIWEYDLRDGAFRVFISQS